MTQEAEDTSEENDIDFGAAVASSDSDVEDSDNSQRTDGQVQ